MARPTAESNNALKRWIVVDFAMIALVTINLALLVVEALFRNESVQALLRQHLPSFFAFYRDTIHAHFLAIDLLFVAVYLAELLAHWAVSIYRRVYHRWFYYPLVHWYDVIGCIPIAGLRFLRFLRVVAIVYRLQRLGVIDLRKTWVFRVLQRYKRIATEEVSDRVVIRVLEGVQQEVGEGSPVVDRLWQEVIAPRKDWVLQASAAHLETVVKEVVDQQRQPLRRYVDEVLTDALRQENLYPLQSLPFVGDKVVEQIEQTVKRVVQSVVSRLLDDARALEGQQLLTQVNRAFDDLLAQRDEQMTRAVRQMVIESIEIVKDQVRVQQWKLEQTDPRKVADQASQAARRGRLPSYSDPSHEPSR